MQDIIVYFIVAGAAFYVGRSWYRSSRDGGGGCGSCKKKSRFARLHRSPQKRRWSKLTWAAVGKVRRDKARTFAKAPVVMLFCDVRFRFIRRADRARRAIDWLWPLILRFGAGGAARPDL